MKFKLIISILLSLPSILVGRIFESHQMTDLLKEVTQNTLFVFDIDNTLIHSGQQLGSPQCADYFYEKFQSLGLSQEDASEIEMKRWMIIQDRITVHSVDSQAPDVIRQLQEKGYPVIALTARHPQETIFTHKQLKSVGIHIKNELAADQSFEMPFQLPVKYYDGILFCCLGNAKGVILTNFLKQINFIPQKIIFIDDKQKNVAEVEKAVENLGIEFVGMRFSGSDRRIAELDPKIVDLQWTLFPKIISDEEAKILLVETPTCGL